MISRYLSRCVLIIVALCAACATPQQASPTSTTTAVIPTLAQPTPASSSAPTLVPPTSTPARGPRTFTEDFRTSPSYWTYLQVENGQPLAAPSIEDGFLVFSLPASNQWEYAIYAGHAYGDATIDVQSQYRTSGDGTVGLVCRYDEKKGWYELNVFADGTYMLLYGQWLTNGVARYSPLYQGKSEKIQSDENEIGLHCSGNVLTPVVNGTQLRSWQELKFGLRMGEVGLSVSSFSDAPFTVGFDWAKVTEP